MLAVPFFYQRRMNDGVFTAGIFAFAGLPLIAGIVQKHVHRSILPVAIVLLFLCPVVYAVTDPLAVEFEKLRDGYFLATGSTIVFVSAVWLASSFKSRRWATVVTAAFGLVSSAAGVFILLWMVMYFE
jgi:drug/metabolite transporter (DMT)-like permease